MKNRFFLLSAAVLYVSGIFAQQNWQWAAAPAGAGKYQAVTADNANNAVGVGYFNSNTFSVGGTTINSSPSGHYNPFVAKFDASGKVLWAQSATTNWGTALAVKTDMADNIYVLGVYRDSIATGSVSVQGDNDATTSDYFIAKYNSAGVAQWISTSNGPQTTNLNTTGSLAIDNLGNVYAAVNFSDSIRFDQQYTLFGGGSVLAKYSPDGVAQWIHIIPSSTVAPVYVTADLSGHVFLSGTYIVKQLTFGPDTLFNYGTQDFFLIAYTTNGQYLWSRNGVMSIEFGGNVTGGNVTADKYGNVYLTGGIYSTMVAFDSATVLDQHSNLYLAKYSATGTVDWVKPSSVCYNCFIQSLTTDTTGNIFAAGTFYDSIGFGNTNFYNTKPVSDIYIVRFDTAGSTNWGQQVGVTNVQIGQQGALTGGLAVDNSGAVYLAGTWDEDTLAIGPLVLTNSNGGTFLAHYGDAVTGITNVPLNTAVAVYPNPATGYIYVRSATGNNLSAIHIFDLQGRELAMQIPSSPVTAISVNSFSAGMYVLQAVDENGAPVATYKFVVER